VGAVDSRRLPGPARSVLRQAVEWANSEGPARELDGRTWDEMPELQLVDAGSWIRLAHERVNDPGVDCTGDKTLGLGCREQRPFSAPLSSHIRTGRYSHRVTPACLSS
jgi:hypothetical protein